MTLALKTENLSYAVPQSDLISSRNKRKSILCNISFEVREKAIAGIVGESGCGKTTLAKILSGFLSIQSGHIRSDIIKWTRSNSEIQLLFQNSFEIINPNRKVSSILNEAATIADDKIKSAKIEDLLSAVNLTESVLEKYCFQLSGGERQRIALARLLAVSPKILILDEPFSAQDVVSQKNLVNVLLNLREKFGLTIICISHNLKILREFADRIIVMKKGEIVEEGTVGEIFEMPESDYTKFLIRGEKFNLTSDDFE